MIKCEDLGKVFLENGLDYFTGVPDSLFKEWMNFLEEEHSPFTNRIACNECEAVALSLGYHLATKKTGVVYLQNSGFGKTVNPLTSLMSSEVYGVPVILMMGWRGEEGKPDEPQHKMMGRIMTRLLDTLEIPYEVLPDNIEEAREVIYRAKNISEKNKYAYALLIKKNTFEEYRKKNDPKAKDHEMSREVAISVTLDNIDEGSVVISTTGKTSRELFETRLLRGEKSRDFLTVGGMGCSSSIALEVAMQKPEEKIYCFDGDGSVLMQGGALSTIGSNKPGNFTHILLDNNAHDSTGGQPTNSDKINFVQMALAMGYNNVYGVESKSDLIDSLIKLKDLDGPNMVVIKVSKGAREDLGRPTSTTFENKEAFINFLRK